MCMVTSIISSGAMMMLKVIQMQRGLPLYFPMQPLSMQGPTRMSPHAHGSHRTFCTGGLFCMQVAATSAALHLRLGCALSRMDKRVGKPPILCRSAGKHGHMGFASGGRWGVGGSAWAWAQGRSCGGLHAFWHGDCKVQGAGMQAVSAPKHPQLTADRHQI